MHPSTIPKVSRNAAMLAALAAASVHISQLWVLPLGQASLLNAAQGVALLLVSLGLIGSTTLSLGLAVIITLPSVGLWLGQAKPIDIAGYTELLLLLFAAITLISSRHQN